MIDIMMVIILISNRGSLGIKYSIYVKVIVKSIKGPFNWSGMLIIILWFNNYYLIQNL